MSLKVLTISYNNSNAPQDFERSLKHSGFAVLEDHPISKELINDVYNEWMKFFNNTLKIDYLYDELKQDGFFPYLTENAKGSPTKDLKEFYHIFSWGRLPEFIGPSTLELFNSLTDMASTLLGWVDSCTHEKVQNAFSMPCLLYTSPSPRDRG